MEMQNVVTENVKENYQGEVLILSWTELKISDDSRVGAMYCFKNCDKNQN